MNKPFSDLAGSPSSPSTFPRLQSTTPNPHHPAHLARLPLALVVTIPLANDAAPPPTWPDDVVYLTRSRVDKAFPRELLPLLAPNGFNPRPVTFPAHLIQIKRVSDPKHPANGQRCLVAKKKLSPKELVIPYLGEIHATLTDEEGKSTLAATLLTVCS